MIKDFSKRATTVALATAGSVAAFGFAGAAPAQEPPPIPECLTFQLLSAFLALKDQGGCYDMDKIYVPIAARVNGATSGADYDAFVSGMMTISHSEGVLGTGDVHRITYTRGVSLPSAEGTEFSLEYIIKIKPDSDAMFATVSLGVDIPGETRGFTSTKQIIGAGGYNALLGLGGPGGGGGTAGPVAVPADLRELTIIDKIKVTAGGAVQPPQFSAFTNTFTQRPQNVPEPSAILGILAVAGVGAFARRKS